MATIESCDYTFAQILRARAFGMARRYAPPAVTVALRDVIEADELVLVIDVDTLERSTLARIDRVMLLALDSLARTGVEIVLFCRDDRGRAELLQGRIAGATCIGPRATAIASLRYTRPRARLVVLSDDSILFAELAYDDRGIVLGRPELATARIATTGDTSVRATLWWMFYERARAIVDTLAGAADSGIPARC